MPEHKKQPTWHEATADPNWLASDPSDPPFLVSQYTLSLNRQDGVVSVGCYLASEDLEPIADFGRDHPDTEVQAFGFSLPLDVMVGAMLDCFTTPDTTNITAPDEVEELDQIAQALIDAGHRIRRMLSRG